MDYCFSDTPSTDCDQFEETLFPVDALSKILQMKVQDEVSPTSETKRKKSIQSQFKNVYSLVVGQAHNILKKLVVSLNQEDKKTVEKEYEKSDEKWRVEMQELDKLLREFDSVDEKYSIVKKEVKNYGKLDQDLTKIEQLNNEKDFLYYKRQEIQKRLLNNLHYKRFAFLVPIFSLINNYPKPFLTQDRIKSFMEDKNNSCSKSRALTTLSIYLQNDPKIGLLISHIVLAILSPYGEDSGSYMVKKSDAAFRYWMIKSAMTTKTKLLLHDEEKRAYIYRVFHKVAANLQEKLKGELTKEHLQCLEEISGKPRGKPLFDLNGKRPFNDDYVEFPLIKQIKKR